MAKLNWVIYAQHDEVDVYRCGANLKIILRRPQNGNALTRAMASVLIGIFRRASAEHSVSRIIIAATGRFFCTGMDLGNASIGSNHPADELPEYDLFMELFTAIEAAPQVTIAAINGPCYAGGVGLAFSCDIRLATASASATVSEVRLGLCPAIISKFLVREWGAALTREAMLSGRSIPMTELRNIGAIHGIADNEASLEDMVDDYLTNLRSCAPAASTVCKRLVQVAGTERQSATIRDAFVDMLKPGAESSIGVPNFHRKQKTDWDILVEQRRAKL